MKRILYNDICRFFAVLAVIAVHSAQLASKSIIPIPIYELGRFGVQLFFLISGSTVALTYERIKKNYDKPVLTFITRRFFRIVPLFILMGIYYSYMKEVSILNTLSPLAFIQPNNINLISGGWSIWNELIFYLIFPLYYFLRKDKNIIYALAIFVLLTFVINLYSYNYYFGVDDYQTYDYVNFLSQFVCFALGIEMFHKNKKNIQILFFIYLLPGIVFKFLFFDPFILKTDYGANYYLALVGILCLIFIQFIKKIEARIPFSLGVLLGSVGRMTYTMYMIHFIVIEIFRRPFLENLYAEINIIVVFTFTLIVSKIIKPLSEDKFSSIGYTISKKWKRTEN